METIIAAGAGYVFGTFVRPRSVLLSVVLSVAMWVIFLLVMAAAVNAAVQPTWVGFAATCFAVTFFFGSRAK